MLCVRVSGMKYEAEGIYNTRRRRDDDLQCIRTMYGAILFEGL